jgi:hypothetical protein
MEQSQAILEANDPESEFATNGSLNGRREREKSQTLSPGDASRGKKESLPTRKKARKAQPSLHRESLVPQSPTSAPRQGVGDFDEFWRVYPKHVGEDEARAAFDKAVRGGADPAAIIEGAKRYAASERARIEREGTPQYTRHAGNWIKAGRWKDEAPPGAIIDEEGNPVDTADGDDLVEVVVSW